ncbi:MAG TPA: LEA type 2 family protein [Longimicrobiales bacterium]
MTTRQLRPLVLLAAALLATGSCATLGQIVQPPEFTAAQGRSTELRLLGPSTTRPLGGASLRIWTRVRNPNAFGLTLAALRGSIFLENERAGDVDFPLGLPLAAAGDTIIPLDINISFSDLPGLVDVAERIVTRNRVAYRLDGTVTVDAAPFGQPTFGPSTWISGETTVIR